MARPKPNRRRTGGCRSGEPPLDLGAIDGTDTDQSTDLTRTQTNRTRQKGENHGHIGHEHHREREPMTRYRKAGALSPALGIVVTACGDDDDSGASDTQAPAATEAARRQRHRRPRPRPRARPPQARRPQARPPPRGLLHRRPERLNPTDLGATLTDGEYNETYVPDPQLLVTGLGGPGGLPEEEHARNIVLATVARASMPVDEDQAMKCWEENGCDTGTGAHAQHARAVSSVSRTTGSSSATSTMPARAASRSSV